MKVAAKPGAAVSHIPKQKTETWRDSTAAAPQVQTRCVLLAGSVAGSAVTNRS